MTIGGNRVARLLGHTLHAERPNELILFDFLYFGKASTGDSYVVIVKDDLSSFVRLYPFAEPDAASTVTELLDWFSVFGVCLSWNSDRWSHFKNQVMTRFNRELH